MWIDWKVRLQIPSCSWGGVIMKAILIFVILVATLVGGFIGFCNWIGNMIAELIFDMLVALFSPNTNKK